MVKRKVYVTLLAIIITIGLVIPSTILVASKDVGSDVNDIEGQYYTVIYTAPGDRAGLAGREDVTLVKSEDWGAVVKVLPSTVGSLTNDFLVTELPDRTRIRLMEQGIDFDSKAGFEVPEEWRVESSGLYLVQFVAPCDAGWRAELEAHSTAFFSMIGDNLAIVKLSDDQKSYVSTLPFVEWMDIYQPYFKVFQNAREQVGTFRVKVSPVGTTIERLSMELRGLGATEVLLNDGCSLVEVTITDAMLPEIAKLDTVGLVQYAPEMFQQGGLSSEIVGAYKVWNPELSHLPEGITGEGQVYQHDDDGFDPSHWDFTQGPLGNRLLYSEGGGDSNSHSTGCVGIAAGNGYDMEGWLGLDNTNRDYAEIAASNPIGFIDRAGFAGRAPEASIVFYDGLVTSEWDNGYTSQGSRIFSNSFGPSVTNGYVNDADQFMASYPEGLVFFCICNYGPNEMTATGVGNGKMVVSVGAAENNRPDWFDTSDNPYCLWTGSAKGPVSSTDMRVKPDVIEYGAGMIMPKSDDHSAADDDVYRGSNNDGSWGIDYDPDSRMDYYKNQGTSFSSPAAAGDAVLIRDYLEDIVGMAAPDPMATKAYLIHGAQDMGYGYPSYGQGWGMCNVEYSICPPAPLTNQYFTGTAGTGAPITVDVNSSAVPLKVTMCHWDSGTTSGALTTDYDIVVTSPTGTRYEGNAFAESRSIEINTPGDWSGCAFPSWVEHPSSYPTGAYDWDTQDDGGDDINNVEVILIDTPEKGTWSIEVDAKSGAGPSWHIVTSADFGPVNDYELDIKQDTPVTWHVRNGYGTSSYQAPAGQTVSVGFSVLNYGLNPDTVTLSTSYQGDGSAPGSPLLAGWSASFDTGASLLLQPNELKHVIARVTSPVSETEGAYPIRVTATSGGNNSVKDYYVFNIDIVNQRLPNRVRVTHDDYSLADMTPGVAAYTDGGTDYVVVAYVRDMGLGNRVFVSVSSDGGITFGPQIQVTDEADDPNYLQLKSAPVGHDYEGRMFISYNGMNPLQDGDDWADASERRAVICYADPPYTNWNVVQAFPNGAGLGSYNDYRENDIGFWINPSGADEVHFVVIDYEMGSNNVNDIDDMAPAERISTDGGATWSGTTTEIYVDSGTYQFSVGCNNDYDGDLCVSYYMISGTRIMFYQQYSGSGWSSEVQAMNLNPYGCQWGYSAGDPTKERYYVVGGRASQSNYNDWKLPMVTYTDNDGGAWSTPAGPLGGSSNICDNGHFDGNNLMDVDVTQDAYAWVTARQVAQNNGNEYWCYNLYTGSSNNGFSSWTDNYPTRDSFAKEPAFHSVAQGNDLLLAYNSVETGHSDVFLLRMYNGWQSDTTDNLGPVTKSVHVPDLWQKDMPLSILANADDIHTGYHNIQAAEYRWDGGGATSMNADDGSFNAVMESVSSIYSGSLSAGFHYVEVRAQDSVGNWGDWTRKWVNIYDFTPPTLPEYPIFAGLQSVTNPGSGGYLTLAWTAAMDYQGHYPITYHIYRETFSGFDPNLTVELDSWAPTANPGDPLTWDDTTVVEGTTYYYIVRAEDTNSTWEYNFVERSGTYESLLFFQVQSPAAGYRNLNNDPFEASVQTGTTDVMLATGDYQIDTISGKWRSDTFGAVTDLSGVWKFYVYGQMNNDHANGTLYAVVKRNSDDGVLFTTGLDDEDIAQFTGSYHMFEWQYTASGVSIDVGDAYYVELWLSVTNVIGGSGAGTVYDYSSGAQTDKWSYYVDSNDAPPTSINAETEINVISGTAYSAISASDNTRFTSNDPGSGDYCSMKFVMNLAEAPAEITEIDLYFEGMVREPSAGPEATLYAWNRASSTWTWVAEGELPDYDVSSTDGVVWGTLSGVTWADYVDAGNSNQFVWLMQYNVVDQSGQSTRYQCDYANITVKTPSTPDGVFTFGYDCDVTPSSLHYPTGPGPTPEAYDIDLTGVPADTWVFVSFPIGITNDVPTIFDDTTFGDGGTSWDCVQWYDNQNKFWRDYNIHKPASLRDTSAVTNQAGFWIHITANGGDEFLTTGLEGFFPSGTTSIPLYAGWNLVGYPSNTSRLASDALAGTNADMISVYDLGQPYRILDVSNLATVTMAHGNAYWVRVPADTTWDLGA